MPAPAAPSSQADVFLSVQTKRAGKVKGEATASGHEDDILVHGWTWGVSAGATAGTGQRMAHRSYKSLTVLKAPDTATTALLSALATNDEVKEAKLSMRKAGESQQEYFTLTLKNARIVSVDFDTDAAGVAVERISITFNKVEVEYRPQQAAGARGASHSFQDEIITT